MTKDELIQFQNKLNSIIKLKFDIDLFEDDDVRYVIKEEHILVQRTEYDRYNEPVWKEDEITWEEIENPNILDDLRIQLGTERLKILNEKLESLKLNLNSHRTRLQWKEFILAQAKSVKEPPSLVAYVSFEQTDLEGNIADLKKLIERVEKEFNSTVAEMEKIKQSDAAERQAIQGEGT